MAVIRLFIIVFIGLSIIYISLSFYSRAKRRAKLKAEWDEGGISMSRDAYVRHGLEEYDGSLRRKLILGVYIVPMALVALIIYLVNFA